MEIKMKKYIILFCISLVITSCIDFTAPERYTEQSYYITGILKAGKTVDFESPVIIGETTPVEGFSLSDLFIRDADVVLYEMNDSRAILDSTILTCIAIPIQITLELVDTMYIYVDVNEHLVIQPELSYRIEALIDSTDLVWSETTVPKTIQVLADPTGYIADSTASVWPEMVFEDIDLEHPIMIETLDNETSNLHAEFYCLENWDEAEYIFAMEEDTYPEDEEEYESEADGSPRKTTTFYIFQPTDNLINFSFYQYAFNFYGKYEVTVSSIDDNYMSYLYKPEGYNHGGINGGVGYFGSAVCSVMYTKVIE